MKWILAFALLIGSADADEPPEATGSAPPAECFSNPHAWAYQRDKEDLSEPGNRFFADMKKCAPTFASAVEESVRYRIHEVEAKKFARSSRFVMAAYGIAWAILALAAVALLLRQQRLSAHIRELESRLAPPSSGKAAAS